MDSYGTFWCTGFPWLFQRIHTNKDQLVQQLDNLANTWQDWGTVLSIVQPCSHSQTPQHGSLFYHAWGRGSGDIFVFRWNVQSTAENQCDNSHLNNSVSCYHLARQQSMISSLSSEFQICTNYSLAWQRQFHVVVLRQSLFLMSPNLLVL